MFRTTHFKVFIWIIWELFFSSKLLLAESISSTGQTENPSQTDADSRKDAGLIEEWSAVVLPRKSFSLGSIIEVGLGSGLSAGIDPAAIAVGAKTLQIKWQIPKFGEDEWAVGMKYVSLTRSTMWWGDLDDYFKKIESKVFRPSVTWSNRVSRHLIIHSFWASGFGHAEAELSDYGAREFERRKASAPGSNRQYEIASKTMQFQSIAGLTEDRFQVTAEWERHSGERILLSTRLERTKLEALETFSARVTVAQHWTTDGLNLRLGAGPQYSILSGNDLDKKPINGTRWLPAADLAVYWVY